MYTMPHLNTIIKSIFLIGETIFLAVVVGILVFSSLIISGKLTLLHSIGYINFYSKIGLAISVIILICICCAYIGASNQTKRRGYCAGRRVLITHNFVLLGVFLLALQNGNKLSKQFDSTNVILYNQLDSRYDSFEEKVVNIFDELYFSSLCFGSSSQRKEIVSRYIDNLCPSKMSSERCCDEDTECIGDLCCPVVEDRCLNDEISFCPYNNCRFEILMEIRKYIKPVLLWLKSTALLSCVLMILNCLLICFNPRDDIEVELLKTGVMTESDLEQIRRLKRGRKFTYEKGNIDLDALHCNSSSLLPEDGLVRRFRTQSSTRIYPDV